MTRTVADASRDYRKRQRERVMQAQVYEDALRQIIATSTDDVARAISEDALK